MIKQPRRSAPHHRVPNPAAASLANYKNVRGIEGHANPLSGSTPEHRYPFRSGTQPSAPQLVIATGIRNPPGIVPE